MGVQSKEYWSNKRKKYLCKVKSYEMDHLTNPLEYGLVGSTPWLLSQVLKWEKLKEHGNVFRPAIGFGELQVN